MAMWLCGYVAEWLCGQVVPLPLSIPTASSAPDRGGPVACLGGRVACIGAALTGGACQEATGGQCLLGDPRCGAGQAAPDGSCQVTIVGQRLCGSGAVGREATDEPLR